MGENRVGAVESLRVTRSGLVIIVCVSAGQRKKALCVKRMRARNVNCFALKKMVPLKEVITGVAVNVEVDQLKGKIPCVCFARCLVWSRQDGVSGETEESLSVLLSFDVLRIYKLSCTSFCAEYITLLQVSSLWACGSSV